MAQAPLFKTDTASVSSVANPKQVKNQTTGIEDKKLESFSSTLDRQEIQHHKKTNTAQSNDKLTQSTNKKETEADITDGKNGEALSDNSDLVEASEKSKSVNGEQIIVAVEVSEADVDHHIVLAFSGQAGINEKVGVEGSNPVTVDLLEQENEALKQKKGLRSDILNALLKTPNAEDGKSIVNQKVVFNKEGLSDKQKILAQANNANLKSSLLTGNASERSASAPSVLLTSAATVSSVVSTTAAGQPTLSLQPALQSEAWSRVLSSRVIWMAREGVQQASLRLNPTSMGPIDVKLHMHNEQASISFIAQHAATRDALEQALPRLRESFEENGMELAHADVSQESFSQANEHDNKTTNNESTSKRDNIDSDAESMVSDINTTEQDITLGLSVFV